MKHLCTYSDSRYLPKGLALYKSLKDTSSEPFTLHYLCLDDKSADIINSFPELTNIKVYKLSDFENSDTFLQKVKSNYATTFGPNAYMQYCYFFSCYFINYLINNLRCDDLMYIDSDIYFYEDIKLIYDDIGSKDVGILPHRHVHNFSFDFGYYNVGVMYFKNTSFAKDIISWWVDAVAYRKYPELSTCGDQKYLEGFVTNFDKNKIHDIDGIGHGAPWNLRLYLYDYALTENKLVWNGKAQPFVFHHFSRFQYDYKSGRFSHDSGTYGGFTYAGASSLGVYSMTFVDKIYKNYGALVCALHSKIEQKGISI